MKGISEFIKTTVIGGLLVIVPITALVVILENLLSMLIDLAGAAAEASPFDALAETSVVLGAALAIAVAICFFTGLLLRTRPGDALSGWIERNIARRLPLYDTIRSLTQRFIGIGGTQFAAAEVDLLGSSARVLGFVVESLPDDRFAVFVPQSPLASIGQVYLVPRRDVHVLDAPIASALNSVAQWGLGTSDLLTSHRPNGDPTGQ